MRLRLILVAQYEFGTYSNGLYIVADQSRH